MTNTNTELSLEDRKRPIGDIPFAEVYTEELIQDYIAYITSFGDLIESFYKKLKPEDFDKQYRAGSWTIKELIHHIAEAHMVHFSRIKLCLTVEHPTVVPFPENAWVELADVQDMDPEFSILMLKGIQKRLGYLLKSLSSEKRQAAKLFNPEPNRSFTINDLLVINAWHGKHHLAQLEIAFNNPA